MNSKYFLNFFYFVMKNIFVLFKILINICHHIWQATWPLQSGMPDGNFNCHFWFDSVKIVERRWKCRNMAAYKRCHVSRSKNENENFHHNFSQENLPKPVTAYYLIAWKCQISYQTTSKFSFSRFQSLLTFLLFVLFPLKSLRFWLFPLYFSRTP